MSKKVKPVVSGTRLVPGHRYRVLHGGTFECVAVSDHGEAQLRSIMSGETFIASEITLYEDGTISWRGCWDLHYTQEGRK